MVEFYMFDQCVLSSTGICAVVLKHTALANWCIVVWMCLYCLLYVVPTWTQYSSACEPWTLYAGELGRTYGDNNLHRSLVHASQSLSVLMCNLYISLYCCRLYLCSLLHRCINWNALAHTHTHTHTHTLHCQSVYWHTVPTSDLSLMLLDWLQWYNQYIWIVLTSTVVDV